MEEASKEYIEKQCNILLKKKIYQIQDVVEEYSIHPNNFLIYKSLIGDESDNIPGVNGFGEKNTPKLFEFLKEDKRMMLENKIGRAHVWTPVT